MAVGITTTDGKDLDDRYIRTISGKGPDDSGNVVVDVPVTSVQGQTGDVHLRISTNSNPLTASADVSNGGTYKYTVPMDVLGILRVTAHVARKERCVSQGNEEPDACSCIDDGYTWLWVKINGVAVYPETSSKSTQTYAPAARYFLAGDTIECYCRRNGYADCTTSNHRFSFSADPTIII